MACSMGISHVVYVWPSSAPKCVMSSSLRLMMELVLCWITAARASMGMGLSDASELAM